LFYNSKAGFLEAIMNKEFSLNYHRFLYAIFGERFPEQLGPATSEAISKLDEVLFTLPERQQRLIMERFGMIDGNPKTLDELSGILDLTIDEVKELESRTMSAMRMPARISSIEAFFSRLAK
jgi:hypothetical protein